MTPLVMADVARCAACRTILRYQAPDGRWIDVPRPVHTCRPAHKSMWRVEHDDDGTPRRMWWVG